jgi:hypothetical protein
MFKVIAETVSIDLMKNCDTGIWGNTGKGYKTKFSPFTVRIIVI